MLSHQQTWNVPWASSDTIINGRTGTKRLLKTCWLQQEAGGVLRFRKASRGMAESRRAQAWGDGPSLPGHVHKVESQLVKEKFYSITGKPCSWLTQVKLVAQNWQISQYFFVLEPLLPWQREPWDNWAGKWLFGVMITLLWNSKSLLKSVARIKSLRNDEFTSFCFFCLPSFGMKLVKSTVKRPWTVVQILTPSVSPLWPQAPANQRLRGALHREGASEGAQAGGAYHAPGVLLGTDTVLFYLIPIMTLQVSFIFPSGNWEKWGLDRLRNFSRVPWPRSDTGGIRKAQSCLALKLEKKAIGKGNWEVQDGLTGWLSELQSGTSYWPQARRSQGRLCQYNQNNKWSQVLLRSSSFLFPKIQCGETGSPCRVTDL